MIESYLNAPADVIDETAQPNVKTNQRKKIIGKAEIEETIALIARYHLEMFLRMIEKLSKLEDDLKRMVYGRTKQCLS